MTSIGFLLFYVLGMLPTYVLPYFGSNSYVAQAVVAAASRSSAGLTWTILHVGALAVCVIAAWARGKTNGKSWLVALPVVAGLFDMLPVMNIIPLVPTIMHVIALVAGFAAATSAVDENSIPNGKTIVTALAGVVVLSFVAAAVNFAYAATKASGQAEQVKRDAQEASDKFKASQAAAAAERSKRESVEAEARARKRAETEAADAKFKAVEAELRTAWERREAVLQPFDNRTVQQRLNAFASALNQSDANGAAAALGVPAIKVYSYVQSTTNMQGISEARVRAFNLKQGHFKFTTERQTFGDPTPTGYKVDAENSVLEVDVKFVGIRKERGADTSATCILARYRVLVDAQSSQPKYELSDPSYYADGCST